MCCRAHTAACICHALVCICTLSGVIWQAASTRPVALRFLHRPQHRRSIGRTCVIMLASAAPLKSSHWHIGAPVAKHAGRGAPARHFALWERRAEGSRPGHACAVRPLASRERALPPRGALPSRRRPKRAPRQLRRRRPFQRSAAASCGQPASSSLARASRQRIVAMVKAEEAVAVSVDAGKARLQRKQAQRARDAACSRIAHQGSYDAFCFPGAPAPAAGREAGRRQRVRRPQRRRQAVCAEQGPDQRRHAT